MNFLAFILALIIFQPSQNIIIAIEVGGRGPKLMLVSESFKPLFMDTQLASPLKDAVDGIMTDDSMAMTTVAIAELRMKAKTKAKEQGWTIRHELIVASSSITAQKNCKTLFSKIEKATGMKALTVTAQDEARLVFRATIPTAKRTDSLIVDIGSGNARLAWVDEDDKLKELTIPVGTVTATKLQTDLQNEVFQKKIKDLVKIPIFKKEVIYVTGGIAWALLSLTKAPTELYTTIQISEIRALDLIAEYNKIAMTENKMTKVFTLPNLIAGSHLFFAILSNFPEDQSFIFVNNPQSWIVEYLKETAGHK